MAPSRRTLKPFRQNLLRLASALALGLNSIPTRAAEPAVPPSQRPNIILILADDLGLGDVGCYGGKIAATPNLDRMAREGTRFTQYYAAAPICSPSRCGLITGMYPGRWRITSFLQTRAGNRACEQADFLDPAAPSLPRALQQAGYATAHIGKWHLGGGRDVVNAPKFAAYGYDEGVGTYESPEPHPQITATDWIWSDKDPVKRWQRTSFFVDRTLTFLEQHKAKPCFINLWLDDPHTPWVPAANDPADREKRPQLVQVLETMDREIGRLLDKAPPNTLILFASDNGPLPHFKQARTNGLRGSKLSLYEGGIRVPLIAWWPQKIPAARVDDTTILSGIDLLSTLCAIANAKPPQGANLDGQDMSQALLGKSIQRKQPLFWEYGRNETAFKYPAKESQNKSPTLAIRDGQWKLLVIADGSGAELYDLTTDPKEAKNLTAEQPDVTRRLTTQILAWRKVLPKFTE